jgi:acyl-CoA thioesterase-1
MTRRPSSGSSPQSKRPLAIAAAVVAAFVAVWLLRSGPEVKNRDSRGRTVIAFGDSLTAGYGAAPGEDYPARLAGLIGREVVNAGVSGDTTAQALARIDADVLQRDPKIVIVGLGGNDFLQNADLAETEGNLRTIIRRIQQRGAAVILLGYRFPSMQKNYEAMYARLAKEEGCLLVEDVLDGILSDPSLKSDEIHPNGRGYAILAERIAPACRKLIAS